MPDDRPATIDRDTAKLGERMARLEVEVHNLSNRFVEHEKADERRHRETIDALGDLRAEVSKLSGRIDGQEETGAKIPLMQRAAFGGMNVREAVSTVGVILAVLAALANMVRGEHVDPTEIAAIVERLDAAPAKPETEATP